MTDTEVAVLRALLKSGRTKTFTEILDDVGFTTDSSSRIEFANALETRGLIQNVKYQLPLTIHADLTTKGLELISART